jgi:hypothetical protein
MELIDEFELSCRYDSRNSFYGKASVEIYEDKKGKRIDLISYSTNVARINYENESGDILYEYFGKYSQTTTRHQKEFFKQFGLSDKEIDELWKNGELLIKGE